LIHIDHTIDLGMNKVLLRHAVFKTLNAEGQINDVMVDNMMKWRHSGLNVYCDKAAWPAN